MTKSILVPVDGSEHSGKALTLAVDVAEKYDANLSVLFIASHKIDGDMHHFAATEYSHDYIPKYGRVMREVSENFGKSTIKRMINKLKTKVVIKPVVLIGDPAEQIVEYSMNNNFDMVVMGHRGLSDIKGIMMGSVSRKVRQLVECTFVSIK
ncbi:MAG: universal stress protein [Deltaproteobacteria bacterium]|nr:universal stress protein [Deltaproteobacteria bacterium]